MVRPAAGAYNIAVRRAPEGLHAVEGLDELLTILKGHTEQAGGEAVGRAGVRGEDADAVEVAGGPEGVRVDEVVVEVVTETIRTETRKEDMRMIEDTKKWVLSPERKAPQPTREYAAHRLDTVLDKFLKTMQTTAARLQEKLLKPEVRQKGKEQVKEKARDSVLQLLNRLQAEQTQRKPSALPAVEKSENRFQS